ncbi:MAG: hypothetical protein ABWK04_02620 [Hydrogenobacter sp.]
MRLLFYFAVFVLMVGVSALLVFLNQQSVTLILTPQIGEYIYTIDTMPLGLLVLLFFFFGVILGYLLHVVVSILR